MLELPITLSVEQFTDLVAAVQAGFAEVAAAIREGVMTMSEQSKALTAVVAGLMTRVETMNTTLQAEMQAIAAALANASDADLRTAASDAVTRLGTLQEQLDAMASAIQGIVP